MISGAKQDMILKKHFKIAVYKCIELYGQRVWVGQCFTTINIAPGPIARKKNDRLTNILILDEKNKR